MLPNLNLIRLFRAVAVHGGIKRATAELRITQSAISQGLSQLERDLGVTLAVRSRTKFSLTREGERFLVACEHILSELSTATRDIRPNSKALSGEFTIGCDITMASSYFLPRILNLRQKYPNLILHLETQLTTENVLEALYSGRVDMVCVNEFFIPQTADVLARKIPFSSKIHLWGSAAYLNKYKIKSIEDLSQLTFIDRNRSLPLYHLFFGNQGIKSVKFKDYIAMGVLLPEAVKHGLGITIGPYYWLKRDIKAGRVKLVLPEKLSLARQDQLCITRHGARDSVIHHLWQSLAIAAQKRAH